MPIFIDTSDLNSIETYLKMGIIKGVTTNPTILAKEGVSGGITGIKEHLHKIAQLVKPLPVSVEVLTNDQKKMMEQAEDFASISSNINIKITIHGPENELVNLEVIHELENTLDIRVNVTAMMSAQQCLLAAIAGASYISLFGGRVNNMGYNVISEIKILRNLLELHNLPSKIIIGSTREVLNIVEWLNVGAHFVTVSPSLLEGMIIHPYTRETVKMFLSDAEKLLSNK